MPAEIFSLYLPNLLLILSVFVVGAASPGPATLMIMNVAAIRKTPAGVPEAAPAPASHSTQYLRGLLLHLTNPKAPLVWTATLSVGAASTAPPAFLVTAVTVCAFAGTAVFIGYACLFSTRSAVTAYRRMRRPFDLVIWWSLGESNP
jgi:threonine/homoserine/homoserine lactone efflux protein